ncbi:type VI secretion protein [Streptomyces maoxianensis]|uniref:Type VI secretion protein n=1 Tax=Streptomyces maoxianensis TaxID=1459942 RepID=A0ABV9G840_9ACTN
MRNRNQQPEDERGIPDGLLVGLLGFLLGLTLLVWTATGLAGVLAHGAWPKGVTFTNTPVAMRALASKPHDLPAAWPGTPAEELSGYGLFWGLAIGELMVLVVLTVFALGTLARWRAVRAGQRQGTTAKGRGAASGARLGAEANRRAGESTGNWEAAPAAHGEAVGPNPAQPGAGAAGGWATAPAGSGLAEQGAGGRDLIHGPDPTQPGDGHRQPRVAAQAAGGWDATRVGAAGPHTVAEQGTGVRESTPADRPPPGTVPGETSVPNPAQQGAVAGRWGTPAGSDEAAHPSPGATNPGGLAEQGWGAPAPHPPRLLYGDPATRRPTTIQAVLEAAGPALVVTSDPTVWAETKDARAKLGPVLVYDPGHLCDTPARMHWSPTAHCEDPTVAQARATALLAPVRPRALLDAAMADTAETLLRCWLHAAAVDGRQFKHLHRWALGGGAQDAVRILRTHPKATAGLAGLLESALTAHPERREIAQQLVVRALSALSSIHIREACTPNRTDSLTLESFIDEGGTIYLVGEPIEDPRTHPGAMPLLTALASDVVEHGRRMAARSSDGRLDPPMTLVLDDVAAVAPLPRLPELLATGQDQGLPTLVLLRSAEQARARWPEPFGTP